VHDSVRAFVAGIVGIMGLRDASVLEVGSLDVNGSVRDLFSGPYIGIDASPGAGVDMVMDAHRLEVAPGFDVVLCLEMVEHDSAFWLTLGEVGRVLRPGGTLILTTRGSGFPEHRYPLDYWRFMPDSAPLLAALASCELLASWPDPQDPGLLMVARREV
jgi:SAM-dependent methyltransferase